MSRAENRLYQLIRERKTAANRSECITTGKISYSTGGIDFAHALSASRVQNAPLWDIALRRTVHRSGHQGNCTLSGHHIRSDLSSLNSREGVY